MCKSYVLSLCFVILNQPWLITASLIPQTFPKLLPRSILTIFVLFNVTAGDIFISQVRRYMVISFSFLSFSRVQCVASIFHGTCTARWRGRAASERYFSETRTWKMFGYRDNASSSWIRIGCRVLQTNISLPLTPFLFPTRLGARRRISPVSPCARRWPKTLERRYCPRKDTINTARSRQ